MSETSDQIINKNSLWYHLGFVDYTDNIIYAVVAGDEKKGDIIGFVGNLKKFGKAVDWKTGNIVNFDPEVHGGNKDPALVFLREHYGKEWVRIPILHSLRPLKIDRVTVRETARQGITLDERLEATIAIRYGLYYEILRPTKHRDLDTGDNRRFSVNSYATLHVVNARPAFTVYQDNFLETASDLIATYLSGAILSQGYQAYKDRNKDRSTKNKLSEHELSELNERLRAIGLEAQSVTFSDPELAKQFQDAIDSRVVKEEEAVGIRAIGQAQADNIEARYTAEANGRRKVNAADATRLTAMVDAIVGESPNIDRMTALQMVQDRLTADATATAIGKLTGTLVVGANTANMSVLDINRNRHTTLPEEPADGESDELQHDGPISTGSGDATTAGVGAAVAVSAAAVPSVSTLAPKSRRKRSRDRR